MKVYWNQSGAYTDPDDDVRDHLWDQIDIDSGIVAVPKIWAKEKGLPEGTTFPWDTDKSLYFVNAYHSLHCLVSSVDLLGPLNTNPIHRKTYIEHLEIIEWVRPLRCRTRMSFIVWISCLQTLSARQTTRSVSRTARRLTSRLSSSTANVVASTRSRNGHLPIQAATAMAIIPWRTPNQASFPE